MNTILKTRSRPTVLFDVDNQEHRYWAHRFLTQRSWRGCPYMFALPQSEPSVYTMITRELALHYLNLEFDEITNIKPTLGVVQMPRGFAGKKRLTSTV